MRYDAIGSNNGIVTIKTQTRYIPVGSRFHMDVMYTAGPQGVAVGGSLRFRLPGFLCRDEKSGLVSVSNPNVHLAESNYAQVVEGKRGQEFGLDDYLFVTINGSPLVEGDTITVEYGSNLTLWQMAANQYATPWRVEAATDLDGSRSSKGTGFSIVPNCPIIEFIPERATHYEIVQPSFTTIGTQCRIVIQARDRYHNIAIQHTGSIKLYDETDGKRTFLADHTFTSDQSGVITIEDFIYTDAGVHRLVVENPALGCSVRSNPAMVSLEKSAYSVYWGDTHCHSRFSADTSAYNDQIALPEDDYRYARDKSALDFLTVTDHVEDLTEEEWQTTQKTAALFNEPGRFVTFSSFEATFQPSRKNGDKNVYFLQDDEDFIQEGTTEDLYGNLRSRKTPLMVIPHLHVPTNWELHDPLLERVVEIYAHWGCYLSPDSRPELVAGKERPAESYVSHALEQGAKLGFIASADHSWGHPGDDFWWQISNHNGGLAAVYAPELTRDAIWDSLWNRHCYATTRARIILKTSINGSPMGSEIELPQGEARYISITAHGTAAINKVRLIKNNGLLREWKIDTKLDVELSLIDETQERDSDYYYVHIEQVDGEQAWASPIWVSHR